MFSNTRWRQPSEPPANTTAYTSDAIDDALSNFKDAAYRLGLTPEQVWSVYADKHWQAIMTFCGKGQVESEPIEGRLRDVILYSFLLLGLIEEEKTLLEPSDLPSPGKPSGGIISPGSPGIPVG